MDTGKKNPKLFCFQFSDHNQLKKIRHLARLKLDHTIMLKVVLRPSVYKKLGVYLTHSEYLSPFINIIL